MQNRRYFKVVVFFAAVFCAMGTHARRSLADAKRSLQEGFKVPSYQTNFPSEQLFSIADIKRKTYKITQSKALRITRSATYSPTAESTGSPMFQITASTVVVDLNGQIITKKQETSEVRSVGFEVGTPTANLDAQPQNVIIRNGTLDNFDMGIVVHKGVKSVRLENVTLSNCPVGIVLLGSSATNGEVASCSMHNVKVIGAKIDDSAATLWAATKIETANSSGSNGLGWSYGDIFVTKNDPETGSQPANGMYTGICMRHVNNVSLKNVLIDGLGYDTTSTGTYVHAISVENGDNVFMENVQASNALSTSEILACHMKTCNSVSMQGCVFNNNVVNDVDGTDASSARRCMGLHMEAVNAAALDNIQCNKNVANSEDDANTDRAEVHGIYWETSGTGLDLRNIDCSHNDANSGTCYGLRFDTTTSVVLDNVVADANTATTVSGAYFETSVQSANLNKCSFNSNNGTTVKGLQVVAGDSVSCNDVNARYNYSTAGAVTGLSFETSVKSLELHDCNVSSNTSSAGAVKGISCTAGQSMSLRDIVCNYNTTSGADANVTALEFATSAKVLSLANVSASNNSANGNGVIRALDVTAGEAVSLDNVACNSNTGGGASFVVDFQTSANSISMKDVSANSNAVTHATNGLHAMRIAAPVDLRMSNVRLSNNTTSAAGAVYGLEMTTSANSIVMDKVEVDGNTSATGDVRGMKVTAGKNMTIAGSSFSDNKHSGTGSGSTVMGAEFATSVQSLSVSNTLVNNNVATGSAIPVHGMSVTAGVSVNLSGMQVNNNTAAGAATGVEFATSINSLSMKDVQVSYTNSSASTAVGLKATAAENVQADGLYVNYTKGTSAAAQGIDFATSAKSIAISNGSANSTTGTAVHGLRVTSGENMTLNNFAADQNNGSGAVFGMEFAASINALTMNNMSASNNNSSAAAAHGFKAMNATAVTVNGGRVNNNSSTSAVATGMEFAVNVSQTKSVELRNMSIDNTVANTSGAAVGLSISTAENLILDGVTASHTTSADAAVQGINLATSAKSVEMSNVIANGNSGTAVHGLLVTAGENITMNNVAADQNNGSGAVYGMEFATSVVALDIHNASCNANSSSGTNAGGFRATAAKAIVLEDLSADYNQASSADAVVGIDFLTSVSSLDIQNVSASNNVSAADNATGLHLVAANAVSVDGLTCNYNQASSTDTKVVYGVYAETSLTSAHMDNVSCDSNYDGDLAYGLYITQPLSVDMNRVSASKNDGDSRAVGLVLDGISSAGSNVTVRNSVFNGNKSTDSFADAAKRTDANLSKHLPVAATAALLDGGFGVYVYQVNSSVFENVEASQNEGDRAGGLYATTCDDCTLRGCKTSFQQANGNYLADSTDPFNGLTKTAIAIESNHESTLFPGIVGSGESGTVDWFTLTKDFLDSLRNIKYLQDQDDFDPVESSVYAHMKKFVSSSMLLRSAIAPFRHFSTAVGVQIHNCFNCVIEDHIAVGNKSTNDSAVGIGVNGTAEGHLIVRAKCSGNEAWVASKKASNGNMDISAVSDFWAHLGTYQLDSAWAGEEITADTHTMPLAGTITSAHIALHTTNSIHANDNPSPAIALDRLPVTFTETDGPLEEFGPAVGGEAIGILVGDAAEHVEVSACDCANNKAHAGKAFGLLQDVTTSLLAKDNRFYQTVTNDLGMTFGMCECTLQSNSVHVGNVMFSNAVGDYLNSNYMIPFDPDDHPNIFFPIKTGYNGDIGNFANASPFDNLEVQFVAAKQTDPYVPNNMAAHWETTESWVAAS